MSNLRKLSILPILFSQNRVGKDGKIFCLYKFRTMRVGGEREQEKLRKLNEADGPVFKIKDDPRFTRFGKWLARTGLDELPQVINVFRGEMALVGPRPLPVNEEKLIPGRWRQKRRSVRPGLTSSWVVQGGHNLSFSKWMELDMKDIDSRGFWHNLKVMLQTVLITIKNVFRFGPVPGKTKYCKSLV